MRVSFGVRLKSVKYHTAPERGRLRALAELKKKLEGETNG